MAIHLTSAAADRVADQLSKREGTIGLRFGAKKSGCSGFAYIVDFAQEQKPEDTVFNEHGVNVFVDQDSLELVDGTTIDFVKQGLNQVFKFNNPQVEDLCGCGESFTVKD